ncbi:hypothetical protein [Lichenibacterium dinghuense]|uniref:hypothetical protein n=1 Tax=Lichenibacterium dinghuense TaxID=2895977 RepID=UPI001F318E70|nr:hypothetical protein [Lichenibacterium sp. 6Y81]
MAVTAVPRRRGRRPTSAERAHMHVMACIDRWEASMRREIDEIRALDEECARLARVREAKMAALDAEQAEADRLTAVA